LKEVFADIYGIENIEYTQYGKPEELTFDYAEKLLLQKAIEQGVDISRFYMIGDNPEGDIEGANRKGWESILVRTGIFESS
jgi:ribonucleotide monophosphatase NagD (HAD superfamily)